jgi:bifunctional non-homologous end joining protein LigD
MSVELPAALQAKVTTARLPSSADPMLATLTEERFDSADWIYERKWDGIRCVALRAASGRTTMLSRNDLRLDTRYPEITDAVAAASDVAVALDGEVVAFRGRHTSFELLQGRSGLTDPGAMRATGIAVFYYVFDILHVDGKDVRALPLRVRKRVLRDAVQFADPLRFTTHRNTHGIEEFRKACERGDEGVVAKRADSEYRPGRSPNWLKFKCVRDQELVIGGYTEPKGARVGFGALLVGYHDKSEFVYAGKVGTGFDTTVLRSLHDRMRRQERKTSPFTRGRIRERDVHWIEPDLVAQIAFTEWTRDGMLRHPRYTGLRTDKAASEVVRES